MQKTDPSNPASRLILLGVVACFVLSGFAALLYQTAWMRQFSLVFGTSELAIAAVLAAYMGGLAFGSSIAARYVHRVTRPVLFYGVLEAGIAISALAVPLLLKLASLLYVSVLGDQPEPVDASGLGQSFFYLIIAFVVLAIPTSFMGATLPLLTKYVVQSRDQIGSRVGLLYATNTLGAIAGTLVAGFLLLPLLGLNGTVIVGVVINMLVFVIAAFIARAIGDHSRLNADAEQQNRAETAAELERDCANTDGSFTARIWILPLMLLSGANSFLYEVLWTRLLGHILGGSIAAFATMLAGFLSGIAIGSAIASRFANTRSQATRLFIFVQCGIALTSMLIYQLLPFIIPESTGLKGNVVLAILVLLPATIFIGATFPLAVRILATSQRDAARSSARVYSWNTVGAILGATVAAFFLIPALKYEGAIKFAIVLNALLALAAAVILSRQSRPALGAALVFSLGLVIFYQPAMPESILRSSPVYSLPDGEIQYYEVGRSATVMVIEKDGYMNLRNNGLPEASAAIKGSPPMVHNQKMLSIMPVLARPDTESMLIVGLGGAVAAEGVPASVTSIDIIELEPEVVKANQSFGDERAVDPLRDPRINITINDARSALTLTSKKYDAIVSQPSHPWTAGASHLYTKEFMQLAADHLSEGGVYLQWMNTQFVDEYLLRSLCATMLEVYPYVRLYQWQSESLFFLGSDKPLDVEAAIATSGRPLTDDVLGYLENGIGSVEDVIVALTMDQANVERFAVGGSPITDNNNSMATMSARVIGTRDALRGPRIQRLLAPYDPLLQEDGWLRRQFPAPLNFPYIGRRLETNSMKTRAVSLANSLVDEGDPQSLIMIALGQERQGDREESQKNLLRALQADPNNQQARYALLRPWLLNIMNETEVPPYIEEQVPLLQGTAAATLQGRMAASKSQMNDLVNLDATLARVLPSDLWYETSVKLRADWRIKVTTPEYQPRFANEATALIDSALVFSHDPSFYSLRMKSTFLADDIDSSVETARSLISRIENLDILEPGNRIPITAETLNMNMALVKEVSNLVQELQGDSPVPEYRLQSLDDSAAQIRDRLELLAEQI